MVHLKFKDTIVLIKQGIRHNIKLIFANKFIYFFVAALLLFILIATLSLLDSESFPDEVVIYYWLLLPGIILIFYPATFSLQNDQDSGMMELLLSIPNSRFKVWFFRMCITYLVVFFLLLVLSALAALMLAPVNWFDMAFQLMFPVAFIGSLAFMLATFIRSGNGTASVMVLLGLGFWIGNAFLQGSEWNLFFNPYQIDENLNRELWAEIVFYNRLYMVIGSLLALLAALLRLQKRDRLI